MLLIKDADSHTLTYLKSKILEPQKRTKNQTTIQPLTFLRNMEAAAPTLPV